ncbi:glycosyltransferase family protein [Rickettsiella massiliensis]|uniref:mannose-1-phosphate guanylyltransferase/mannose-6-phosphate isomerase PslB n=1 Tax=Rickettsiella massiliensis TaxID=676517 RepID=UPI00029AF5C6|nr:mannose-1-phosphate guanylyltransferase/mannose-6-phosphate isomerase PslB [Rickettsiella massiliensis]
MAIALLAMLSSNKAGRIIAGLGLNNLTIVDTKDALLISDNQHIQQVKQLVERLKHSGRESYRYHPTVYRPWGYYTVLEEGSKYKLKRIIVHPQASLSLQLHHHRSEYWIMIEGTAQVQRNDEILIFEPTRIDYDSTTK